MTDLALTVQITRALLGLGVLDINDHDSFYVSPTFLGGQVTWNRTQVTSPFLDGAVTVNRTRGQVTEQIQLEILGVDQATLATNIGLAVAAFTQDSYTLNVGVGAAIYQYACEAADYQLMWSGPRSIARQAQMNISVLRSPIPVSGPA